MYFDPPSKMKKDFYDREKKRLSCPLMGRLCDWDGLDGEAILPFWRRIGGRPSL
ncbi:MAG: hypothetical protein QXH87_02190 [Candidatus Bathyarchaeia archaeon]